MQFRTQIPIAKSNHPIDYDSKVVSLGSCFAVNISQKFDYFKFRNFVNPFGIVFHPLAIEKCIDYAIYEKIFSEKDIFEHNEIWHSFDVHSDLNTLDKQQLLDNLNAVVKTTKQKLSEATHIIITLGTAWAYRHNDSGNLVANCHKVPQKHFTKELLSTTEISESILNTIAKIRSINSEVSIVFTVSPVRHIKDGFVENQWSKSNLFSALQGILSSDNGISYFPSYEIMMDELRDYRFYADDMLHPNSVAIDYIWERFSQSYISETALLTMQTVASIQKGLAHRPFNSETKQHQDFRLQLQQKIKQLQRHFPQITF